jgi:hypothetical protein
MPSTRNKPGRGILLSSVMALLLLAFAPSVQSQTFTNLAQLTQVLNFQPRTNRNIRLEVTVCAASRPEIGVVAVQDDSGVELLELGDFERELRPGEKILIQGYYCLLRQREMGIELSAGAAVDNDGFHVPRTWGGSAILKAGYNPIRLDWFNALRGFHLEVLYSVSNAPRCGGRRGPHQLFARAPGRELCRLLGGESEFQPAATFKGGNRDRLRFGISNR